MVSLWQADLSALWSSGNLPEYFISLTVLQNECQKEGVGASGESGVLLNVL